MFRNSFFIFLFVSFSSTAFAQQVDNTTDTFFLAKKKGLLGRLGRSVATRPPSSAPPVKAADPYKKYNGKVIRSIETIPVGFNQNLNDTAEIRRSFAIRVADRLHRNTRNITVRKNLFFKEGDRLLPLLVADNERFLRDLPYIRDAAIVVYQSPSSKDSVDVVVLTRDIFSIGGNFNADGLKKLQLGLREENFGGTGSQIGITSLYEKDRSPAVGIGAELIKRNIRSSFLNATIGFKSFNNAVATNRQEENTFYLEIEKPLINRYTEWTGAFSVSHNQTTNAYIDEALYRENSQYKYNNIDLWAGYNIGWGHKRQTDSEKRLRHFVSARSFYTYFDQVPLIYKDSFKYSYANLNGLLFSYSLYKQNYYLTNFIYGFGRNEDVPIGINASVTAGWTNKQNRMRGYYGAEFDASSYSKKGFFSAYTIKGGAYKGAKSFEDISLLMNVNHFTRLRQLSRQWFNRNFFSVSYTRLFKEDLNEPIVLRSDFGLPYFRVDSLNFIAANSRATFKGESVFFNLHKFLGFRFAPFIFTEVSFLKSIIDPSKKAVPFTAIGGGIRTRNENLVLGTVEVRAYYFPNVSGVATSKWKIDFHTNLKFKYNSTFITKPDFAGVN